MVPPSDKDKIKESVKGTVKGVKDTVKGVKDTAKGVKDTVKGVRDVVKKGGDKGDKKGGDKGDKLPSQILNLKNWSLALPIPVKGDPDKPQKIKQPELNTYESEWFYVKDGGVAFRCRADGVTSANTHYPRSELREMINNGKDNAAWSTSGPTHTMEWVEAVTKTTKNKPHVCCSQVHGVEGAPLMFRMDGKKLYIQSYGDERKVLETNYKLGTKFSGKFVAGNNKIDCYYNGNLVYTLPADPKKDANLKGCYYKMGLYLQSSVGKGGESPSDTGEVIVYDVKVY